MNVSHYSTIAEVTAAVKARKVSPVELVDATLPRMEKLEPKLTAFAYPDEAVVGVQGYSDFAWAETVNLWVSLNRLLIHLLLRVPENKLDLPCRIGVAEPVPLARLMETYLEHCEDIVGQILSRL